MQQIPRPAVPTLRVSEQCRVVLDNDWSGDPDGLVALAHHLLSPANRVVAVTSSLDTPVPRPAAPGGGRRGARRRAAAAVGGGRRRSHTGSEELFGDCAVLGGGRRDRRRGPAGGRPAAVRGLRRTADQRRPGVAPGAGHRGPDDAGLDRRVAGRRLRVQPGHRPGRRGLRVRPGRPRRPVVPGGDLPAVRVLRGRAGTRPGHHRAARALAVGALHRPAGLGPDRRQLAARRQPAGAGDGADRGVQPVDQQHRRGRPGERRVYTDVDTRLLFGDLLARLRAHERGRA